MNTEVPGAELEKIRDEAWNTCNSEEFKSLRKSWQVNKGLKNKANNQPNI